MRTKAEENSFAKKNHSVEWFFFVTYFFAMRGGSLKNIEKKITVSVPASKKT